MYTHICKQNNFVFVFNLYNFLRKSQIQVNVHSPGIIYTEIKTSCLPRYKGGPSMKVMVFYLYELLTLLAPAALFLAVIPYTKKSHVHTAERSTILAMLVFALYLFAVFHVTGAGTLYDIKTYQLDIRPQQLNLLPFSRSIDPAGYAQNILLFIPLGFLLPLLGSSRRPFLHTLSGGLCFSLLIELSQLLNNRSTDVDDLIMNSLGAVLGYAVYKIAVRIFLSLIHI